MATAVNFFQPGTEAAVDYNSIARQRELAKMLMQQSQNPASGQMVGGQFVAPGKLSYVNQIAQALTGALASNSADEREAALGQRVQAQRAAEAQSFMQAATGSPASTREVAGPPAEGQGAPTQTTAAVPADMNKALALALQSQNPMLSGMAPEILKRNMEDASFNQALQSAGFTAPGAGVTTGGSGAMATGGASMPAGDATGGPTQAPNTLGLDKSVFAMLQSKDPRAQALAKALQEQQKPTVLAEGGTALQRNPDGSFTPTYIAPKTEPGINVAPIAGQPGQYRANPVQGYAEAKANAAGLVAGSEAAARDPYAGLVKIGDRWLTPAQARAEALGGAQGGPPAPTTPTQQPPVSPVPNRSSQMVDQTGGVVGPQVPVTGAFELGPNGRVDVNKAEASIGLYPPGPVRDQMTRALQQQQTAEALAAPTAGAGRGAQGGAGIPVQSEASQAYATSRAKSYAEMAPKLQQAGLAAASDLRSLDALEQAYKDPNVAKGALAENISGLKNVAASFGIDMKGLGAEQFAEAVTNKMALAARSTAEGGGMPGAMSDSDRKFLANMQPGLTKTPEGRAKIMDASRKVAQRQLDMTNMAREYEMKNGQLDIGFDKMLADYAAKNQMFTQATPGGGSKTNLNDLLNKYR